MFVVFLWPIESNFNELSPNKDRRQCLYVPHVRLLSSLLQAYTVYEVIVFEVVSCKLYVFSMLLKFVMFLMLTRALYIHVGWS